MKKIYLTVMTLAMMVAALGVTACGGDDDDIDNGGEKIDGDYVKVIFEGKTYQESMPFYMQIDPVGKENGTPLTFTYDAIEHFERDGFSFMLGLMHYSRKADLLSCSPGRYSCKGGIYNGYVNFTLTTSLEIDYDEYDFVSGTHQVTSIKEMGGRVQIEGNFTSFFEYRGDEKSIKGSYRMTIPE